MSSNRPIDQLTQRMRAEMLHSNALFGFVFVIRSDGSGCSRVLPLSGTIQRESTLRKYLKPLAEQALAARSKGVNRSIKVETPPPIADSNSPCYAAIITQQLGDVGCVAVLHQLKNESEASRRLRELETTLQNWQMEQEDESGKEAPTIRLDRMLETCVKWDKNAILVAGYPAFLRFETGLRALTMSPISSQALADLGREVMPEPHQIAELPGVSQFDLSFGEDHQFRFAVLGRPQTMAIIITQLKGTPTPLQDCNAGWTPTQARQWVEPLKKSVAGNNRDALVLGGAPPLTWAADGIYPVSAPVLTGADIRSTVDRTIQLPNRFLQRDGYTQFSVSLNGEPFRVAMFGYPSSPLLLYQKLPAAESPLQVG
ncbi:MAG: hypothetical protein M3O30_14780 [Planctomycetota bacterium]|nr:hypothetical protein [Planctomycetota bacterium]